MITADEYNEIQDRIKDISVQLIEPTISPDEYAILSTEYISLKRKISSLKNRTFMEEV